MNEEGAEGTQSHEPTPATPDPVAEAEALPEEVPDVQADRAAAVRLAGAGLPPDLRGDLEEALDADLSGVRIHADEHAARRADALDADAYTEGSDIHFGEGQFEPGTREGKELIAHEVAHFVQQTGLGKPAPGGQEHEHEADNFASAFTSGRRAAPVVSGTASGIQRKDRRPKPPVDDWDPAGPKPRPGDNAPLPFEPQINTYSPPELIKLGDLATQHFSLANPHEAPKGTKYTWSFGTPKAPTKLVGSPKIGADGLDSSISVRALTVGATLLSGELTAKMPGKGKAVATKETHLMVRGPTVVKAQKGTTGADGDNWRPVYDKMLLGENLVITLTMDGFNPDFMPKANAVLAGGGFTQKGMKTLKPGTYEVTLKPTAAGSATAEIYIVPDGSDKDQILPYTVTVNVDANTKGEDDPRPKDMEAAKSWITNKVDYMFAEKMGGMTDLYEQGQVVDPLPETSRWGNLVSGILMGVLSAGLAGVAAGIGLSLAKSLTEASADISREMVKNFLKTGIDNVVKTASSEVLGAIVGGGGNPMKGKNHQEPGQPNQKEPPKMAAHVAFRSIMEKAINKEKERFKSGFVDNHLKPEINAKEKQERGTGYTEALKWVSAFEKEADQVRTTQYDATFGSWCSFMAKVQLGEDKEEGYAGPDGELGTDLRKQVDTDKMDYANGGPYNGPLYYMEDPAAGILNLALSANRRDPSQPVTVTEAELPGLNNAMLERVGQSTIRELKIPMTAYIPMIGDHVVVGKNEVGTCWSSGDAAYLRAKGGSAKAADGARKIFDEIADTKIKPRKKI